MATIIAVANETRSSSSRITKEGKKITYQMNVIQQPERARACGSGAKSSADRRPVDPPPIVELRIFEGEAPSMTEITFSYNANFFLFATLENARTMAQGRVPPTPASFPVLTGTPVAGMAYLDRPAPAGYFIFPDLSVRHEGKYRLSFALYEELKEQKDMDNEDRPMETVRNHPNIDAHVSHRLEVKSTPFTVFSAKKFPGLTESTTLSRMVAEQGCRVRIRRDVRMRRRDNKANKDWDDYDDDTAYDRARRTATPDAYGQQNMPTPQPLMDGGERPRSVSNASNASYAPPPRRPSMQELAQAYQPNYPSMPQPQGNGYSQMQYGSSQAHQCPSYGAPQSMMQPPQAPYQPQQHSYQAQPPMQMPAPYGYIPAQQYGQNHYDPASQMRHESFDYTSAPQDYRRAPVSQPQSHQYHASQMMPPFGTLDTSYNRTSQMMGQPQSGIPTTPVSTPTSAHPLGGHSLAPLKTLQPQTLMDKLEPISPSYAMPGPMSTSSDSMQSYRETSMAGPPKILSQPQSGPTKRSFSSTFDTQHVEQPLRQGARPNVAHPPEDYGIPQYDGGEDEYEVLDARAMSYRRADGTHRSRRVPLTN